MSKRAYFTVVLVIHVVLMTLTGLFYDYTSSCMTELTMLSDASEFGGAVDVDNVEVCEALYRGEVRRREDLSQQITVAKQACLERWDSMRAGLPIFGLFIAFGSGFAFFVYTKGAR